MGGDWGRYYGEGLIFIRGALLSSMCVCACTLVFKYPTCPRAYCYTVGTWATPSLRRARGRCSTSKRCERKCLSPLHLALRLNIAALYCARVSRVGVVSFAASTFFHKTQPQSEYPNHKSVFLLLSKDPLATQEGKERPPRKSHAA